MRKAKAAKSRPVVMSVISDLHAGSVVGLSPAKVRLDDGGYYEATPAQNWLWQSYNQFWQRVEAVRDEHEAELYTVFNGDLVDGQVKHSTQIISGNMNAQAAVVNACMAIPLELKPDAVVIVRGTEAHTGQSACVEERIADGLRRDKRPVIGDPETGTASWWHFRAEIQGVRLDITHHGRTGQREHTRAGAAILHAHDILLSHVKNDEKPPHLCLRGHYHRFNDSGDACPVRVVTTGAFQLKTGYVHKVAADSMADVGGVIVVIQDGAYTVEKVQFKPSRGPVWRPTP